MMIGFAAQDGTSAIELFGEKDADELVGEGHLRQGYLFGSERMDGSIKTIGAAHDEHDATGSGSHSFAKPFGKLYRPTFCPVFVKQNHVVASLQLFLDELSLLRLLLLGREGFGVAQFWNHLKSKRHIVAQTLCVVIDKRLNMLVCCFSYDEEYEFQSEK